MAEMKEIICACGCGRKKMVRTADIARGWGKFYSKSCKAKKQERRTGANAKYMHRIRIITRDVPDYEKLCADSNIEDGFHPHDPYSLGQWDD